MKTAGIKKLMELVLASLPKPHTDDVIDDVFHAIEHQPEWLKTYEDLCIDLTKTVVNTWGGFWISNHEGRASTQQVSSKKSTLIGSYSKLGATLIKTGGKRKELEALELMSAYFHRHKAELPERVRKHRDLIVELLMEGVAVDDAFSMVLSNH